MDRAKLAKSNLKKSIYFGGSIGLVTLAGGLAVAIPTYYKIKKNLEKTMSSVSNLSSYMSQLVNKLGVSPDEDFVSELEGGYELVYQNGETRIFRRDGESKTLVMNMNADGSVGSAATMTGPAALGMIQLVQSAAATLSDYGDSMKAVLGPFAEAAEKTSLQIESAVTGTTPAQILARNALANPDATAAQAALDALKADTDKLASLGIDASKIDDAKAAAQADVDKQRADAAAEAALSAEQLAAQRAQQLKEAQQRIADAEVALKNTYKSGLVAFYNGYKAPFDKENGIIEALDITQTEKDMLTTILKMSAQSDIDAWIAKPEVKVEEVRANFNAAKNAAVVIETMAAARAQQAKSEADAAVKNDNLLVRIASNLDSFLNAYARTFGYENRFDSNEQHVPEAFPLRSKLGDKVMALGMSPETLHKLDDEIQRLLGTHKDVKLTFSIEVNTFSEANPDYSKLVVLKANTTRYTGANQFTNSSEYVLATSGVGTYIDLNQLKIINNITFPDATQLKQVQTTVEYVVQLIKSNILVNLKNEGIKILKQEVRENTIRGISDPKYFDQLSLVATEIANLERATQGQITNQAMAIKALKKQYLVEWLLKVAREYLFDGKLIQFNGNEMISLLNKVVAKDAPSIPHNAQNIYSTDGLASYYGEFMNRLKAIIDASSDKQIDNRQALYSIFGKGLDVLDKYDATKIASMKSSQPALYDEIQEGLANGIFGSTTKLQDLMNIDSFKEIFTDAKYGNYDWTKLQDLRNYSDVATITSRFDSLNNFAKAHNVLTQKIINSQNWGIVKDALLGSDAVFTQFIKSLETLSNYDITKISELQTSNNALFAEILSASNNAQVANVMSLDSFKTLFTEPAYANYDWTKLTDLRGYKDLSLVDNHIKQILAIANTDDATKTKVANLITSNNWAAVKGAILNDQTDITFTIKDMLKYAENKNFDMTNPANQEKIQAASGVSAALAKQTGVAPDQAAKISDKMTSVMTSDHLKDLTADEFKTIVTYTDTVFKVLSPAEAAAKLLVVLEPADLSHEKVAKIAEFNRWIADIEAKNPGKAITRQMIEQYVWTLNVHTESVQKAGAAIGDGIVSAVYVAGSGTNPGETYIIRHGDAEDRPLWKVVTDGITTALTQVVVTDSHGTATTLKAFDGGGYISSQAVANGVIYYMPLNNAQFVYKVDVATKQVSKITLTGTSIAGTVRSISVIGNILFAAGSAGDKLWSIDLTNGAVTAGLSLPAGFTNAWAMGGAMAGTNPVIVQGVVDLTNHKAGVFVTMTNGNYRADFIDLTQYFEPITNSENIFTAIIAGDYIAATNIQTFFVIGIHGEVIKIEVKVLPSANPQIINAATLKLISATPANGDVRGATFANGAITTYTASKAVYIASQTAKLSDIFAYLM